MRNRWHRFIRQSILLLILLGLMVYVAADAVRGAHGLNARQALEAKIAGIEKDLAALKAQRARLEREAELLGPKAAEQPALIDEQARALLDLAQPTDIVIVNDGQAQR